MDPQNTLSDGLRAAFTPSPLRSTIAAIVICLLIGALAVFCVREVAHQRKTRTLRSAAKYSELRDRHQLLPAEEAIIALMVTTLSSMNRRHLLLTNQGLFNTCAQRLLKKGEIQEADLAELRVKLGFPQGRRVGFLLPKILRPKVNVPTSAP